MPIVIPDSNEEHGKKDARRHREKQREAIKNRLPEIISEEAIITGKRGKIVKIPIRGLDIPHFKPSRGDDDPKEGIGQGSGQPGDIIDERPAPNGKQPGGAGEEPGVDYIETEVEIEEIIALMLEDLGLPKLESKNIKEILVELGYKITGRSKSGPWALLNSRATAKEGMKRFWYLLRQLQQETGLDELTCFDALDQAGGLLEEALKLLADPNFKLRAKEIQPFPIFGNDDLRFLKIKKNEKPLSRAVMIAMMDVSGSMDNTKKYLARSMLFWLVEFLRQLYSQVEIRFITHHTKARIVNEEEFFKTGESGGTECYSAYELAGNLIDSEYPVSQWNVYLFHFSDGDDFKPGRAVEEIKKCFGRGINMFGYGQVEAKNNFADIIGVPNSLYEAFEKHLPVTETKNQGLNMLIGKGNVPFLGMIIAEKKHLLPALKQFLRKDRWQHD